MHAQKAEICRFALGSALCMHRRHAADKVSPKFPEETITFTKLQAKWIFRIRMPFVKPLHVREKAWLNLLIVCLPVGKNETFPNV